MAVIEGGIDSIGSILENRKKFAKYFEDDKRGDMSIETFYELLIAEMTNQDPMEPMSNTEFVSQMASFTSLKVQQEALYYNNSNYAASLAGKSVIVAGSTTKTGGGLDVQTGVVEKVNLTGGAFEVTVNGKEYPLNNIMEVIDGKYGLTAGSDGAFATSLIGKHVTVSDGKQLEAGVVQRIEILAGEISVIVGNYSYPLKSVIKVENYADGEASNADGSAKPGGAVVDN